MGIETTEDGLTTGGGDDAHATGPTETEHDAVTTTLRSDQRYTVVGKTGSGKSVLATRLMWESWPHVVFYDWKHEWREKLNAPVLTTISDLREAFFPRNPEDRLTKFVFAPENMGLEVWDETCRACWELGHCHLIADELKGVYQQDASVKPVTDHHEYILTRGRTRGVGITGVSQRPKKIPMEQLSESEHIFAFRTNLKSDRDRLREIMGEEAEQTGDLSGYEFLYYNVGMDEPIRAGPLPYDG